MANPYCTFECMKCANVCGDSFEGLGKIELARSDEDVDYGFEFPIASAPTAFDGCTPSGQWIQTVTVSIHKHPEQVDYTAQIVGAVVNTATLVTVPMTYPYTTLLDGGEPLGEIVMQVDATAGMRLNDVIGVELTSDLIHWTRVASIPDATHVVLAAGLPSIAADNLRVLVPRITCGIYHLRFILHWSRGGDCEYDFNRVFASG